MPFYPDSDTFYDVIHLLFDRLSRKPGATDEFARSRLIIHVHVEKPAAFIGLDARSTPIGFHFQPDGKPADLQLYLEADVLHGVWLSQIRLRDAFFGGQIKTKGSVFKAMQLAPLFRQAEQLYPHILREKGLQ
ncbi:MAG: SCP2 sterol-binding domain-containing protein [Caldilineales bacterium]|nr:SCP2 sterol-binding domain-containing protein [Caldilineales bacterium]